MVQFDKSVEPPVMETCVLIPEDFSLKIDLTNALRSSEEGVKNPYSFLGKLFPSIMASQFAQEDSEEHPENGRLGSVASALESCVKVCATKTLPVQTKYLPFSGTVRTDKLPFLPYLTALDVRHRLGSYDEMVDRNGSRVRLCNWVRFVNYKEKVDNHVNLIASRSRGSVLFEVVKEIAEGEELVVFLLPDSSSEDPFSLSALAILRSSIYRRTLDSIISEAPLDLSRSLLSTTATPPEEKMTVEAAFSSVRKRQDPEILDGDLCSSPKRRCPSQSSPSSFLTSVFQPNNVLPGYFPFGFPPRPIFHPSAFPFPKLSPVASDNLHPNIKATIPQKDNLSIPGSSPLRPHSSPVRIHATPKRRERTMLPCSVCGKAFDRPSLLKRHMRTHTGEKPHVCDVCEKGFSTSSSLNTHRRIHSGEKPHQCGVCGKRFTASSNLYYHKMTHVKEKPHKCTLCTRSFPTPGDLRSHMFVHNGQWPHKCTVCGKGFSKLTNLRNHTLLHSGDRQPKRSASPNSFVVGTTSDSFPGASSLTPSPPPSSSFITSTPSRPATPLHPTSPYSSASSSSSPPLHDDDTPSDSILNTKTSKTVSQASKRFLSISFLARSASKMNSPPRPSSPRMEEVPDQTALELIPPDQLKIHTVRESAQRLQEESRRERESSFEDCERSPKVRESFREDHKQFREDGEFSPFSSDLSPIRNSSPSASSKLLDHSSSRSSSPLSMSIPLQLSLPSQLFTSTSYSPLFSLASSYLASSFTTPTSTIFSLPPSVSPSILPLLTQNNPFSTSSSLPSPPLSPSPENESLIEREKLKDFIHKHSLTKDEANSEDENGHGHSGASKTSSSNFNHINFLAALAQSRATNSDAERFAAFSNFKRAEELFLKFQNGDLKLPPIKEEEYEFQRKDKKKTGKTCGLELVGGGISENNVASNSKIESLNEL